MFQQVDNHDDQFPTAMQTPPPPDGSTFSQSESEHQQYNTHPGTPLPGPQQQHYISHVPTSMQFSFPQPPASTWSTGLCHCCDDPASCKHIRLAEIP